MIDIASFLEPEGVIPASAAHSKKQILQEISRKASQLTGLSEREVLRALLERERLGSTGVGRGIAIPHARFADLHHVTALFARIESPVEYDAADDQPVDLLFVLLVPEATEAEHLRVMARASRVLREEHTCASIRDAVSSETIYAILTAGDAQQEFDE